MKFFSPQQFSSTVPKGYGLLWLFLNLAGIGVFDDQSKSNKRYVWIKIFPLSLFLMHIYLLYVWLICIVKANTKFYFYLSSVCLVIISIATWVQVNKKKYTIKRFVIQFHRIGLLIGRKIKYPSCGINISLFVGLFITFTSIACYLVTLSDHIHPVYTLNTFRIKIENKSIEFLVCFSTCSLLLCIMNLVSLVYTVMCSSLYYICSELLNDFSEDIVILQCREPRREELIELLERHKLLHKLTLAVGHELSPIAFLLLCSQTLTMFTALSNVMNIGEYTTWLTLPLPSMVLTPCSVIGLTLSASRVQSKYREIHMALQNVYYCLISQKKEKFDWNNVAVVKSILDIPVPTMTASGIVELKPGLILSVFGSLFTYGLLVLNI